MTRPTRDRIEEIRKYWQGTGDVDDLLAEIDGLREELKQERDLLSPKLVEMVKQINDYHGLEKERDALRAENEKLKEIINHNLTEQLYCERAQGSEIQQLRERVGKLEEIKTGAKKIVFGIYKFKDLEFLDSDLFDAFDKAILQDKAQDTCIDSGHEAIHSGKDVSNECVHKTVRTVSSPPDETI